MQKIAKANAGAEISANYSSEIKNMPNADQIMVKQIEAFTICLWPCRQIPSKPDH
jgi:hypothetical protein